MIFHICQTASISCEVAGRSDILLSFWGCWFVLWIAIVIAVDAMLVAMLVATIVETGPVMVVLPYCLLLLGALQVAMANN
jgi:hypothetical protein